MNFDTDNSPKKVFLKGQKNLLENVEGKPDREIDKASLIIAGGLTLIEGLVAFFILESAGILIALVGALFPGLLLWAMANFHAEKVEELDKNYNRYV